jgi:hypothetical protein
MSLSWRVTPRCLTLALTMTAGQSRLISAQGASYIALDKDTALAPSPKPKRARITSANAAAAHACTEHSARRNDTTRHDTASRGPEAMSAHVGCVCLALQQSPCTAGGGRESVTASHGDRWSGLLHRPEQAEQ